MKYSEMIKLIKSKYLVDSITINQDSEFVDIALLNSEISSYREDTLYIGHIAQVNHQIKPPLFLLYFGYNTQKNVKYLFNSAQIREDDFPAVFNLIKQELIKSLKVEKAYSRMLKMILDGKGLSSILCETSRICGNPLVVIDISGKILAYSEPFDISDPMWIRSVERGYCPYEFMKYIERVRTKKISPPNSEPFISVCPENQLVYLCSKILAQDRLLGYVFMFQNNLPINSYSKELLPLVSKAASEIILRNHDNIGLRSYLYQSILTDMLKGVDPNQASIRIKASKLTFPKRMKVLIVRPLYYRDQNYIKGELMDRLQMIFNKAPLFYYKKEIVIIAPLDKNYNIDTSSIEKLNSLAKDVHLQVGISNPFYQVNDFVDYYKQADEAIRFAQFLGSNEYIHNYMEYSFYSMLSTIPLEVQLSKFCHPALGKLRVYDYENGTDFYNTLKVLTETSFSTKEAADKLHLHRNTLNYRRKRIEDICGLDFDDSKLLFELMYSFKIEQFLKKQV